MTGAKVQDDLFDIVQRFRLHTIVVSKQRKYIDRSGYIQMIDVCREFCGGRHQINQLLPTN